MTLRYVRNTLNTPAFRRIMQSVSAGCLNKLQIADRSRKAIAASRRAERAPRENISRHGAGSFRAHRQRGDALQPCTSCSLQLRARRRFASLDSGAVSCLPQPWLGSRPASRQT